MQRLTSVVVGLLVAAGLVFAVVFAGHPRPRAPHAAPKGSASGETSAPLAPELAPAGSSLELPVPADPLALADPTENWPTDGGKPLPADAPNDVGFGVILFTYQGVQLAPPKARTKAEALALAKGIIESAKKDFSDAVKKGDHGSTADAGRIPRGVLEPDVEYALFTLEKGGVYPEPLETPRGYWVVRRTE
jgi:PPIC-type PPIASE domain